MLLLSQQPPPQNPVPSLNTLAQGSSSHALSLIQDITLDAGQKRTPNLSLADPLHPDPTLTVPDGRELEERGLSFPS